MYANFYLKLLSVYYSEPAPTEHKVHATDSVYSELNDYDAPKRKGRYVDFCVKEKYKQLGKGAKVPIYEVSQSESVARQVVRRYVTKTICL